MFEDAAQALEEIEPEDKTRREVLYARVDSDCFQSRLLRECRGPYG